MEDKQVSMGILHLSAGGWFGDGWAMAFLGCVISSKSVTRLPQKGAGSQAINVLNVQCSTLGDPYLGSRVRYADEVLKPVVLMVLVKLLRSLS